MTDLALETGIGNEIMTSLIKVFKSTPNLDEVIVFGSRAKGNYSEGSDIDLAIKGKNITIETVLGLMSEIDRLDLLYKVEIQNYDAISNDDLREHIDRAGKTLWRRTK